MFFALQIGKRGECGCFSLFFLEDRLTVAIDLATGLLLQEVFLVLDFLDAAEPVAENQCRAAQGRRLGRV